MNGAVPAPGATVGPSPRAALSGVPWVVLASGASLKPQRPIGTRRVVLQVIAAALAVIIAVALLGAVASRRLAERQAVNDAASRADLIAELVIQPLMRDELLAGDTAAIQAVDKVVREHVLDSAIVRVKIWAPDGRIVYSDEPRLIGQQFPLGPEELEVLADPQTRAEVSDLSHPENIYERGKGNLLEVYRPVWTTPANKTLLFETYSPYDEVTKRGTQLWRGFSGLMLSSLLLLVVLLMPVLWRLLDQVRQSVVHREAWSQRAVDASHEERRRIAGTLHDGVVQELAATSFTLAGSIERAEREGSPALAAQLRQAAGAVRGSIGGLRSLLVDLYPPSLDSSGLAVALDDLVGPLRRRGVNVTVDLPEDVRALGLDADGERLAYRVARECLFNIAKHAQAANVMVRLHRDGDDVVLDVTDDGVGFDPVAPMSESQPGHFGLRVLADVAEEAGAFLAVAAAPGRGTSWQLRQRTP